ncbi:Phosphoglucomutase, first 3 domain-containing protein [Exidia glandulosa HHB12029]|uniref:Phosphoglucomutase, first 3 domain-containing protein n=1 Tax=Exidia glandulosa HHB12029 TaxID=1314781 RepID=A0A166AG70_EXIGL|nr:Phosphoglucomutase, first 3 domain-containing protein [Exidia glandulosa HHB12029]
MSEASIEQLVQDWLRLDRDPASRKLVEDLWRAGDSKTLERYMRPRLEFGTAGLRGPMRAGWAGLNDLMVVQTCQGMGRYAANVIDNALTRGVVIGHDHRHNSRRWAEMAAESFSKQGYQVFLLRGLSFTPLVPFGVTHLRAAIGCMITASHNPGEDNGIKLYWENAVQIISPHDEGIAAAILQSLEPASWELLPTTPLVDHTSRVHDAYFTGVLPELMRPLGTSRTPLRIVHTSLHGVAEPFMRRAFALLGDSVEVFSVPQQSKPDPDFPTTPFPNPEEKGTLDLAMSYADQLGVSCVYANDPDADRFSVAEKVGSEWKILTGNEVGVLLAATILHWHKEERRDISKVYMITTVVSSKMLQFMAEEEGFSYAECLTGFKNIGNLAGELEQAGHTVLFSYEEALGYAVSTHIKDKDGISTALVFAQLMLKAQQGLSLRAQLDALYAKYGYFVSSNGSVRCESASIQHIFAQLRYSGPEEQAIVYNNQALRYPQQLAGLAVTRIIDRTLGYDSTQATAASQMGNQAGQMVQFYASTGHFQIFLTIRASGTEPKVKYYLEGKSAVENKNDLDALVKSVANEIVSKWLLVV